MGKFEVEADAHAEAKIDGDYGLEGPPGQEAAPTTEEAPKTEEAEKSVISEVDPGDPEAGVEPVKAESDDDESSDEEDEEEDKPEVDDTPEAKFDVDYQGWTQEFIEHGALSDETRTQVIDAVFHEGVPAEMKEQFVQAYEAGLTAIAVETNRSAHEIVGGTENYSKMVEWASETLETAEVEAFDADVLGTDIIKRDAAIKGLNARMHQALGSEPNFEPDLAHNAGRAQGDPIIGSRQELVKIQRTPEYKKDPAVRAKVARQLKQSMDTGKYVS